MYRNKTICFGVGTFGPCRVGHPWCERVCFLLGAVLVCTLERVCKSFGRHVCCDMLIMWQACVQLCECTAKTP